MVIKIDAQLKLLSQKLSCPLYVVGGYVRNFLIDKSISSDIDLCSSSSIEEITSVAQSLDFSVVATYKRTGTVVFKKGTIKCEWTAMRKEIYHKGGHHTPKKVIFCNDILSDAKRRDFKCNAVYYDIKQDKIIDPLGGVEDIKNKILSTVIDAEKVFCSDGLRLMRLARFVGELGFNADKNALHFAKKFCQNILDVSRERIFAELKYILSADKKHNFSPRDGHYRAIKLLSDLGVLGVIVPHLEQGRNMPQRQDYHKYDVLTHTLKCVYYAPLEVRLSALLHDIAKPYCMIKNKNFHGHDIQGAILATKILKDLKCDTKTIEEVAFLVGAHMRDLDGKTSKNKIKRFIVENYEYIPKLYKLKQADYSACMDDISVCPTIKKWKEIEKEMISSGVPFNLKELKISAKDLIEKGYKGEQISKKLNSLFYLCIDQPHLNQREKLLNLI